MTYKQMIEGLEIFAKYSERGLNEHINGADHDVIWACSADVKEEPTDTLTDTRISSEDQERLKELGWFISREFSEAWTHYC